MNITEIRFTEDSRGGDARLLAYVTLTFDGCFVVRDLRLIEGPCGPFLAMPYRKLADPCPACRAKNHLRARFCNQCGGRLACDRSFRDAAGRPKTHADVCHPVDHATRAKLTAAVAAAWAARPPKETAHAER